MDNIEGIKISPSNPSLLLKSQIKKIKGDIINE